MTDDFVTRLERQLAEAERRQLITAAPDRGGIWTGTVAAWRIAAATALVVVLAVGVVTLTSGGGRDRGATPDRSAVVARIAGGDVYELTVAAGSVWINDLDAHQVIGVDAATRRVIARIPADALALDVAASGGAVWLLHGRGPALLTRIDPVAGRVSGEVRIDPHERMQLSDGPSFLRASGARMWVLGEHGGVRIDPDRGTAGRYVRWPMSTRLPARGFALSGRFLWVHGAGGALLQLDARTGALRLATRTVEGSAVLAAVPSGDVIVQGPDGTVRRIAAEDGRTRWTARLGGGLVMKPPLRSLAVAGDVVWALREDPAHRTELLTALDLATGRERTRAELPKDTGADLLTPVGSELWLAHPAGGVTIVRP